MACSSFNGVAVRGVVASVPPEERRIDDEVALFGGNPRQIERIKKTVGLDRRRVAGPGTTAADLNERAARELLAATGVSDGSVDALICVTQTPEYPQPCDAAVLHGRLGFAKSCAAFDVNLGCSGYVYGLWLAHMMIASGGCARALVLAGDAVSRLTHPRDRAVAPVFGDGGSATLVEAAEGAGNAWFDLRTDGAGYASLIVPAGGARRPADASTRVEAEDQEGNVRAPENLFMDGSEVFNFTLREEPAAVRAIAGQAGLELDAIDHFVFHQANRYILSNIAKRLKIDPAKVPMGTVERFGNQSSASIPAAIAGELAEAVTEGPARTVLLSGFGVGLSWASAILSLGGLEACRIVESEPKARAGAD